MSLSLNDERKPALVPAGAGRRGSHHPGGRLFLVYRSRFPANPGRHRGHLRLHGRPCAQPDLRANLRRRYRPRRGDAHRIRPRKSPVTKILDTFWKMHDPTTLNRQGADVGTQYRSAIFYETERPARSRREIESRRPGKILATPSSRRSQKPASFTPPSGTTRITTSSTKTETPTARSSSRQSCNKIGMDV